MRRWLRYGLIGLMLALVSVLVVPAARIAPLYWDDWTLDRIVIAVALDWRDFGLDRAHRRLQFELDQQGVGPQVDEQDCVLAMDADRARRVHCAWEVLVLLPWGETPVRLAFDSTARIDPHGVLLR